MVGLAAAVDLVEGVVVAALAVAVAGADREAVVRGGCRRLA